MFWLVFPRVSPSSVPSVLSLAKTFLTWAVTMVCRTGWCFSWCVRSWATSGGWPPTRTTTTSVESATKSSQTTKCWQTTTAVSTFTTGRYLHCARYLHEPNRIIYSQLSNKGTGTIEKNLGGRGRTPRPRNKLISSLNLVPPKSLGDFSCGTIGKNSRFWNVVLLFHNKFWKI